MVIEVIGEIEELRSEGEKDYSKGRFEQGIIKFEKANSLIRDHYGTLEDTVIEDVDISPIDLSIVMKSEMAYGHRQSNNISSAKTIIVLARDLEKDARTASARGRLNEEAGLIDRLSDYNYGSAKINTQKALGFYLIATAESSPSIEDGIYSESERDHRLLRTYGLFSMNHRDLAESANTEDRKKLLEEAVRYATMEIEGREDLGEKNANAYHTIGNIQVELIALSPDSDKEFSYQVAKGNLDRAIEYCKTVSEIKDGPREIANINYALVRAAENYNPGGNEAIVAFQEFKNTFPDLSNADIKEFRDQQGLYEMADNLGFGSSIRTITEKRIGE